MQPAVSLHQVPRARTRRRSLGRVWLLLPIVWSVLLGVLAYQVPTRQRIDVGQLGDQLFLRSSETQRQAQIDAGDWYVDQLGLDGRYRWSRARGTITLPGLGRGRDVQVTLTLAGWPADVLRDVGSTRLPDQPTVRVLLGDQLLSTITPTSQVAPYSFSVPAAAQSNGPLVITLESSHTFTDTATSSDARPKGVQLDTLVIEAGGWGTLPDWRVVGGLALLTTGTLILARSRSRRMWLIGLLGTGVAVLGATAIVIGRMWLAGVLPSTLVVMAAALLLINWRWWRQRWRSLAWRWRESHALDIGLVATLLACSAYVIGWGVRGALPSADQLGLPVSDAIFVWLLRVSLLSAAALVLIGSVTVLPRWVLLLRHRLLTGNLAAILLGLTAGVWLGYEFWLIYTLPFVGHADYADNAVVARNLLRGRGFVVDYVTQFYELLPSGTVTRPQETWPLLQPVLMLPAFAALGPTPFAARLPNIVFLAVLTLLIFHIGSRMWDRRVGLIAAVLTITNLLFFRLAIFATSDLALVVWSMAAFWLVYNAVAGGDTINRSDRSQRAKFLRRVPWLASRWLWAGVFTGLMILQKPSAALFALGMGVWAVWQIERQRRHSGVAWRAQIWRRWPALALWTLITLAVVSPYLVRNVRVFGTPFFSTESYDAWILFFRGTGEQTWGDIYRMYAPNTDLGAQGVQQTLPNRSWILWWGWDLTLGKLAQQARDAWAFFAPPKGQLLNWDRDGVALSWLMVLGLATLRRRQRDLIGMVATVIGLYTLFLIMYWHTHEEQRYFVPFVPWLALLAAWGACWLFDRIAAIGRGRWAGWAGLCLSLALLSGTQVHRREINAELDRQQRSYWGVDWQADLEAFAWIRQNTAPDAVIMTRVPWQLNFHADRPAVMIPTADYTTIMRIAKHYGADYLLLNGSTTSLPEKEGGALRELATATPPENWKLVYRVEDQFNGAPVLIYQVPPDYDAAKEIVVERN